MDSKMCMPGNNSLQNLEINKCRDDKSLLSRVEKILRKEGSWGTLRLKLFQYQSFKNETSLVCESALRSLTLYSREQMELEDDFDCLREA